MIAVAPFSCEVSRERASGPCCFLFRVAVASASAPGDSYWPTSRSNAISGAAKCVHERGGRGDFDLIVTHESFAQPVGAIRLRLFPASDPGYDFTYARRGF